MNLIIKMVIISNSMNKWIGQTLTLSRTWIELGLTWTNLWAVQPLGLRLQAKLNLLNFFGKILEVKLSHVKKSQAYKYSK